MLQPAALNGTAGVSRCRSSSPCGFPQGGRRGSATAGSGRNEDRMELPDPPVETFPGRGALPPGRNGFRVRRIDCVGTGGRARTPFFPGWERTGSPRQPSSLGVDVEHLCLDLGAVLMTKRKGDVSFCMLGPQSVGGRPWIVLHRHLRGTDAGWTLWWLCRCASYDDHASSPCRPPA